MSHELSAHPCFDRHLPWEGPRGSEPPPRACWEHTAGPAGHPGPGPETSLPLRELGGRRRATSLHFLTVKKGTKPMGAGTGSGSFSELVRPCASWTVYTASAGPSTLPPSVYTASICLHCLSWTVYTSSICLHCLHLSTLPPSVYTASAGPSTLPPSVQPSWPGSQEAWVPTPAQSGLISQEGVVILAVCLQASC